jgi:hypothetical protein
VRDGSSVDTETMRITVGPPAPRLTDAQVVLNTATVEWTWRESNDPDGFLIELRPNNGQSPLLQRVGVPSARARPVHDLDWNTRYTIVVKAYVEQADGDRIFSAPSNALTVQVGDKVNAPAAPRNLDFGQDPETNTLTFTWDHSGGNTTYFALDGSRIEDDFEVEFYEAIVPPDEREFRVVGLPGGEWHFTLYAFLRTQDGVLVPSPVSNEVVVVID